MKTFGSLFAGIGGFDLGFERAGWKCSWQVENDPSRIRVLEKHWPDVPRIADVRDSGEWNLEPVDAVLGGFPCTDLSVASFGSHAGLSGAASGLVFEFSRIAKQLWPDWIVIENVSTLRSHAKEIQNLFSEWEIEYAVLNAKDFGALTRRNRVFFVGHLGNRSPGKVLADLPLVDTFDEGRGGKDTLPMCLPWKGGPSLERLAACTIDFNRPKADPAGIRKGDGIPGGVDRRVSDTMRWDMIGNAVSPNVAEWIGRKILEVSP